ncbi:MAG: SDR family NAD(P)-dependent oxidoreductase [Actinomycetota bacterium]
MADERSGTIETTNMGPLAAFRLDGRVAIVTGASSGLGVHFARTLHAAGARVVLAARRIDRLSALEAELPGSVAIAADLSDAEDRERLVRDTVSSVGPPRILVNNAGVGHKVAIEDESIDTFRSAMEVNVTALWHLSKLCAPHMREAGSGNIVNVASMFGIVGSAPVKQAHYCASKGAVLNLTRELALQWARRNIRVNALCPGWFPSEMTEAMSEEASMNFLKQNSPIPRMGELHELDGALLLLASDACSFMTGQQLVVDGGWTAR